VLGRDRSCFVKHHSDSTKKFSETDIINMLEFLIDKIFVIFGGRVFQQTATLYQGNPDRNHKLWNIVSTEKYILHIQVLLECCYM
jgi:hypothetical protein